MRSAGLKLVIALGVCFLLAGISRARQPEHEAQPDNVQGSWEIYSKNIDNGVTVKKFVHINQDGHNLSGNFRGPNQSGKIHGLVNGHHIEFSTQTRNVMTFRGEIEGNEMHGLYGIHGRRADWRAVREN